MSITDLIPVPVQREIYKSLCVLSLQYVKYTKNPLTSVNH